ncbi:probable G-protein coupled receptor AH9.1 [Aplysia californica]|uniref:Probable G-protein coupled receptor AH9.1 n=1 Tax=Aplysia californica TaxID=6500 RepID=A0ABM0K415_APLCA|nr:probable G-protein coupled receptor AH9.1 [Aplysia californica]
MGKVRRNPRLFEVHPLITQFSRIISNEDHAKVEEVTHMLWTLVVLGAVTPCVTDVTITRPHPEGEASRGGLITDDQLTEALVIYSVLICSFEITGLVFNTFNLIVFVQMGVSDPVNVCFFALAVSDHCLLATGLLAQIAYNDIGSMPRKLSVNSLHMTMILLFYAHMFLDISILISTFISLQRCCCVAWPLKFKSVFTTKRSLLVIICIHLYALASYFPLFLKQTLHSAPDLLRNSTTWIMTFSKERSRLVSIIDILNQVSLCIITQVVVLICLGILTTSLRSASKFRKSARSEQTESKTISRKEDQVVKTVTLLSVVFVVTYTPAVMLALIQIFVPEFDTYKRLNNLYFILHNANDLFENSSAVLNFLVYLSTSTRFRKTFWVLLHLDNKQEK